MFLFAISAVTGEEFLACRMILIVGVMMFQILKRDEARPMGFLKPRKKGVLFSLGREFMLAYFCSNRETESRVMIIVS